MIGSGLHFFQVGLWNKFLLRRLEFSIDFKETRKVSEIYGIVGRGNN